MSLSRETIEAEIKSMQEQQKTAIETYHQTTGAIASLQWVLQNIEEQGMTMQQLNEAIKRGANG